MSIIFLDGFDLYPNTAGVTRKGYSGSGTGTFTYSTSGGRFGGGGLQLDTFGNSVFLAVAAGNTYSCGFAFKPDTNISGYSTGSSIMAFMNGGSAGTVINKLGIDSGGALKFGRGDFTTNNVCSSASGLITANAWYHIEVVVTRNASTGSVFIYLNGSLVASATGVNTGSATIDTIDIGGKGSSASPGAARWVDDLFLGDAATQIGDCKVETIRPTADTATKDWTHNTGTTNFGTIDDFPTNDDTDYNSSATVGNKDLFDLSNLATTPSAVKAVQTVLISRKDDAAVRELRTNMKNGATTTNGTTRGQGTSYQNYADIYNVNPDTAAAFTASDVNAMQLGYEVVT
jgi:hypothetical protein